MFWKKQHKLFLYHYMAKILFETGNIAQLEECLLSMDKALSLIQNSTRKHTHTQKKGCRDSEWTGSVWHGGEGHSHNKDSNASDPGEWQSLPWGETRRDYKAFFRSECKICHLAFSWKFMTWRLLPYRD